MHHEVQPPRDLGNVNAVLVNCFDKRERFPAVVPDEVQGGRTATELLIEWDIGDMSLYELSVRLFAETPSERADIIGRP